ncbi:UNVERIFIED_CONTAM: putative disease resistance RPP13-like protein 3 [Sesamum radiatum]|uniref:Disease resistance RPP13-like protein 3 n=1 Tax=Sesamum radiatum TaxID=300843 RepID=A0AAW2RXE0_SESRA
MHLKALVDRNLIFVRQQETNGNVKSYSIHDLLRDLCVRKAHEEKFLFVHGWTAPGNLPINTSYLRRVCTHEPFSVEDAYKLIEQIRVARSLLLFNGIEKRAVLYAMVSELRLLRVLDILRVISIEFPEEILQLVNLRYLALTIGRGFPSSISRLCNLQTLIAHQDYGEIVIPHRQGSLIVPGILDMPELRHIKLKGSKTYVEYHGEDKNRSFRDEGNLLSSLIFPPSLKKLTLWNCSILDHDMHEIGKLPNLQILKLLHCNMQRVDSEFYRYYDFPSGKWVVEDGEFCQLQFLLMEDLNLVTWVADDTHFPRLEHLVIRRCGDLKEIPLAIGDIPTLKVIEVDGYSLFAAFSAMIILLAQLDIGNDDFQVRIL